MTIEVSSTDRRDGKALALFAACDQWQTGHTRDGRPFFAIPGSEPGLFHMADQRDCSCPDRQRRSEVCKHMRAVRLWMAAFKAGAVAPKRRRPALDPASAALPKPLRRYEELFTDDDDDPIGAARRRAEARRTVVSA